MNSNDTYETVPDSIGEYVPGDCPTCAAQGEYHQVLVCRICGAPPALDGKCVCDWADA